LKELHRLASMKLKITTISGRKSQKVFMTNVRSFKQIRQQLSLLDIKADKWQVSQQPPIKPTQHIYSTKEVVKFLSLDSAAPLYRAKKEGAAYWHQSEDIKQSKIVVPMGMRDKWTIYHPLAA
jgi:Na+-transporting NADH:ubiquinone oxidoreductase subunit NqrC